MTETVQDRITRLGLEDTECRIKSLEIAHPLVDDTTFIAISDALRMSRSSTIVLPAHRFENLSRGRGWARKGRGASAEWGHRVDGGYRVGPGRWSVGGHDGFSRKKSDEWVVKHVQVGDSVWTIAN